jgi:hypothetical protein
MYGSSRRAVTFQSMCRTSSSGVYSRRPVKSIPAPRWTPATCPGPGYPANYLATVNLTTGALSKVALSGAALHPKGQIFVKF